MAQTLTRRKIGDGQHLSPHSTERDECSLGYDRARKKPESDHPFFGKVPMPLRPLVLTYMKMLAERENLSKLLVPWEETPENREKRVAVKEAFFHFISKPSRYRLKALLNLGMADTEFSTGDFHQSYLLRVAKESPRNFPLSCGNLDWLLEANGIVLSSYNDAGFVADLIASVSISVESVAYLFDRNTVHFYTDPTLHIDDAIGGWANRITRACYLFSDRQEFIETVLQHEFQHLLDTFLDINFDNFEYVAHLAEIAFCGDDYERDRRVNSTTPSKIHQSSWMRIRKELIEMGALKVGSNGEFYPDDSIQTIARGLLNKAYFEKTGFTYDELIEITLHQPAG